jgi:hypothetical protein
MNKNNFVTVVVLSDGETFTEITGCSICVIPRKQYDKAIKSSGSAQVSRARCNLWRGANLFTPVQVLGPVLPDPLLCIR